MRITPLQIRAAFGNVAPPTEVWEKQFDGQDKKLARIGRMDWQLIGESDLAYYLYDLCYMELQPDLFAHLFPVCLNFWYDSLMRNESAMRGAEFHRALQHGLVLRKMVTLEQREFIYDFMYAGFSDRLKHERGFIYSGSSTPAYGWMGRFNSIALIVPIIERIWSDWWRFNNPGSAVAAFQWASGLMYEEGENPIFQKWTGDLGGGGPYLAENDSEIYDSGWLPPNIVFLQSTLSSSYLCKKLKEAAEVLQGEPEYDTAFSIANQVGDRRDAIDVRIGNLLAELATPAM